MWQNFPFQCLHICLYNHFPVPRRTPIWLLPKSRHIWIVLVQFFIRIKVFPKSNPFSKLLYILPEVLHINFRRRWAKLQSLRYFCFSEDSSGKIYYILSSSSSTPVHSPLFKSGVSPDTLSTFLTVSSEGSPTCRDTPSQNSFAQSHCLPLRCPQYRPNTIRYLIQVNQQ